MTDADTLRNARNILLKLHKSLVDFERESYERVYGPQNSGQFLNILLEDENFAWLRKFSTLIVEIDEMFDLKDGVPNEMIKLNLEKIRELVGMKESDEFFRAKYQHALQTDPETAGSHAELKALLTMQ